MVIKQSIHTFVASTFLKKEVLQSKPEMKNTLANNIAVLHEQNYPHAAALHGHNVAHFSNHSDNEQKINRMYWRNSTIKPCNNVLYSTNTVLYSENTVLYSGNTVLYSGNTVLYSGNTVLYSGSTTQYSDITVLYSCYTISYPWE